MLLGQIWRLMGDLLFVVMLLSIADKGTGAYGITFYFDNALVFVGATKGRKCFSNYKGSRSGCGHLRLKKSKSFWPS